MNRLNTIASMVLKCNVAADIGTDHGYVPEILLKNKTVKKIIATDINDGPLNRAIEYLNKKKLNFNCEFRLGDGLTVLNENEAEVLIIAGMGGELIAEILEKSKDIAYKSKQLILQPMTAADKLRKYLHENNFIIIDEKIVKEYHHYYFILNVEKGYEEINDNIYYEISRHLVKKRDKIMIEYVNKIIETNKKIINNLEKTNNDAYNKKIEYLKKKNIRILEVIDNWN